MKQFFLIVTLALSINTYAQDADKTVTLVVSGQGKTQDEARQKALRGAIEQAFGTFISSKTEILNDNLIKDEIVSIANGNIQKFDVISEVQIPNGGYATSLKATVSVTKLTSFVERKGVTADFKGNLFAFNIKQQIFNEQNEGKVIEDLCLALKKIANASFEYTITVSDPIAVNASNEKWRIPLNIGVKANKNLASFAQFAFQTLKGLSLTKEEASNYVRLGKKAFPLSFSLDANNQDYFLLRNESSVKKLIDQLYYFNYSIQNFSITNGLEKFRISNKINNNLIIDDEKFRPFVIKFGKCTSIEIYEKGSVFFDAPTSVRYRNNTPLLEWTQWAGIQRQWRGCGFGWSEIYNGYDLRVYSTKFPYSDFFDHHFRFLQNIAPKIINGDSGFVVDFSEIPIDVELIKISLDDIISLEEIKKITEYKIVINQ